MKRLIRCALLVTLSLVCFPPAQSSSAMPSPPTDTWLQGAHGYERAIELQKELNLPLVVYFWAGWCPYCQKLDSQYLPTAPVQDYLRGVIKVRIYPEQGAAERALAKRYNVRGYPSFFVIRQASAKPVKVHPFRRGGRNLTPTQFAEACRAAGPVSPNLSARRGSETTSTIIEQRTDTPVVTKKTNTKGGAQIVTVAPPQPPRQRN